MSAIHSLTNLTRRKHDLRIDSARFEHLKKAKPMCNFSMWIEKNDKKKEREEKKVIDGDLKESLHVCISMYTCVLVCMSIISSEFFRPLARVLVCACMSVCMSVCVCACACACACVCTCACACKLNI